MSTDSAVPYAPSNKEITTELVEMFRAMGIDDATASEYLDSLKSTNIPSRSLDTNANQYDTEIFNWLQE